MQLRRPLTQRRPPLNDGLSSTKLELKQAKGQFDVDIEYR